MMAKTTWIAVLTSAAIIGGIIGAGTLGITRAEKTEARAAGITNSSCSDENNPRTVKVLGLFYGKLFCFIEV